MNKKYGMENSDEFNDINYYEKIIQDLQYTNTVLNNRNISLETELEIIKNKYNLCIQDLNDINKHIAICKDTQEKTIKDLKERNDYLEQLYSGTKGDKNIQNKLHAFIEKMKILFDNDIKKEINDEDYLEIFGNNIIKLNEELSLSRNELNKKIYEINKLKHEIQNMKSNNNNFYNNLDINIPKSYTRVKTPIGHYKEKLKYLNNNKKIEIYQTEDKSNSPKSFRIKENNKISMPKTPQINQQTFDNSYNIDIPFNKSKNKKINIDKKLINSHSLNLFKLRTLKESPKDKNYINNNNNNNLDSNDLIQSLMNNVKNLENTFNKRPNKK